MTFLEILNLLIRLHVSQLSYELNSAGAPIPTQADIILFFGNFSRLELSSISLRLLTEPLLLKLLLLLATAPLVSTNFTGPRKAFKVNRNKLRGENNAKEKYTEKDVANLIAQVEEAFTSQLAKAETSLAKSEDGESHRRKSMKRNPNTKKSLNMKLRNMSPKHMKAKTEHGQEGEEHEGHDYDEEDMAHMEKMYRSMSKGEQKAHHDCLRSVWDG